MIVPNEELNKLFPSILPQEGDTLVVCHTCKGRGTVKMYNEETKKAEKVKCPDCDGNPATIKTLNY